MIEVKISIYMTNIALSQDYQRSSLHRHNTIFFSKIIHAADNTAATRCHCDHAVDPQQQEPMTVAAMPSRGTLRRKDFLTNDQIFV